METDTGDSIGISIHAPREGSDFIACVFFHSDGVFQSTLPVKGATGCFALKQFKQAISIHAPREGSDASLPPMPFILPISIHAPREGSDGENSGNYNNTDYFNPRSP